MVADREGRGNRARVKPNAGLAWRIDGRLREVPVDAHAFDTAADERVAQIEGARGEPARLLRLLEEAAPLFRIAGRDEDARKTAAAAIALAQLLEKPLSVFVNQLALARALQWERRYEISTPLFDQLVVQARSTEELSDRLHDVLHFAGTNLYEQRRYSEAARLFREALKLRRALGEEALMEATADALRLTKEKSARR
jgi:tetratricopeptide (TPR) repeat protein